MPKQFKKYIRSIFILGIALLALIVGFNWFVNPFDIYGSPVINGFNADKPEMATHARMMKAYAVRVVQPETVIIGSSRALWGIDPNWEGWVYHPVYNLALQGVNVYEELRYFQHAQNIHPLKQVLLNLDFFAFGTNMVNTPDFNENELSVDYNGKPTSGNGFSNIAPLFSLDTLLASLNTVRHQEKSLGNASGLGNLNDGFGDINEIQDRIKTKGGYHAYFRDTTIEYLSGVYLPGAFQYNITTPDSPYTYYRKILQIAYQDGIDLRMAISPCHARQWQILEASGLWPRFEDWKRTLVMINEEEAKLAGKAPFPLWDFGNYNELTTEPVPPLGDAITPMRWYWDSSHYKKELGDLMLDEIFGYHSPGRVVPGNLGILINSQNIENHLLIIRADSQIYKETHPDDIKEIQDIAKTVKPK